MPDVFHRLGGYGGMWLLGLSGIALMSRQLKKSILRRRRAEDDLHEANARLEQRVAERTAELAASNGELETEIVERKQAEQWLLESEQRFRSYFEQGLVGMAILSAQREWVEVNGRLCGMLGYTEEEIVLKVWADLTHPDDLAAEEAQFQRVFGGVTRGFVIDKRFVRKDGAFVEAALSVQCLRNSDGSIDCLLLLVQDMAARKHA